MGFFNTLFGKNNETDDQKELRKYEKSNTPNSYNANAEFVVEDIFYIKGRGTVVTGTVTSGTFNTGDEIIIISKSGDKIKSQICGIETFRKIVSEASKGTNAGFLLDNVQKNQIQKNDIIKKECN